MLRAPTDRAAPTAVLPGLGLLQVVGAPGQPLPARQVQRQVRAPEEACRERQGRDRVRGGYTTKGTDHNLQVGPAGLHAMQDELATYC